MSFDGQFVRRPSPEVAALLTEYVPVRITDMRGVDLARWRFDWDLTFAVVVAEPDGTILHRYGGRDERGADVWLSMPSLAHVLRVGLESHADHRPAAETSPVELQPLERVPAFAARDNGECIHCHSVYPALHAEARAADRYGPDDRWVHPSPRRIGFDLDRDRQDVVTHVSAGSPAARAGILAGDRLVRLGDQRIASASDVMAVLDATSAEGATIPLALERDGTVETKSLDLDAGWKRASPLEFSWRPSKWPLTPAPGFGGPRLTAEELAAADLPPDAFAFRVTYLVDWGENRRFGEAARAAGLRKGDVFLEAAGKRDFASVDHFHAWWRLTRGEFETVPILVRRETEALPLELPLEIPVQR